MKTPAQHLRDALQASPTPDRRRFLAGLGALPLLGAAASAPLPASAAVKTQARIVIAGGGAAGLTAASRLSTLLEGASITIVDARKEHYYQPGFTLVAAGIKPQNYVVSGTGDYVPKGVEWVADKVAEIDPEGRKVVTAGGKSLPYDFLIVATGLELNYGGIQGMDTARIGQNGLGSIYHSPQAASATWQAMSGFADKGGVALFGRPAGEMKCAGAPLKYTFITDDHLRRRNNRSKAELIYMAQSKSLFGVPIVAEKVRMLFQDRGVKVNHEHVLQSIDLDKRVATYKTPTGTAEQGYDFIN
ncbi:MAG: sulfide:quinone oxidoreductase, partial [Betaproteobacteria bacterium]|nr:sulfide:quinone oxidoreductase [Betaproteobacteria bacterium]